MSGIDLKNMYKSIENINSFNKNLSLVLQKINKNNMDYFYLLIYDPSSDTREKIFSTNNIEIAKEYISIMEKTINDAKELIKLDYNDNILQGYIDSFSELHDYVDANMYTGHEYNMEFLEKLSDMYSIEFGDLMVKTHNIAQSQIDSWLKTNPFNLRKEGDKKP